MCVRSCSLHPFRTGFVYQSGLFPLDNCLLTPKRLRYLPEDKSARFRALCRIKFLPVTHFWWTPTVKPLDELEMLFMTGNGLRTHVTLVTLLSLITRATDNIYDFGSPYGEVLPSRTCEGVDKEDTVRQVCVTVTASWPSVGYPWLRPTLYIVPPTCTCINHSTQDRPQRA